MKRFICELCLIFALIMSVGCGQNKRSDSVVAQNIGNEQEDFSEFVHEAQPASEAFVDQDMSEYMRVQEEMEPKRIEIRSRALEVIPEEYQDDEAFDLQIGVYDIDAFSTMLQLDIHSGDLEDAKKTVIEIHNLLQGLEEELEFQSEGYSFTIVNNGEPVAFIGSTKAPGEYSYLFEDEYGTFTAGE